MRVASQTLQSPGPKASRHPQGGHRPRLASHASQARGGTERRPRPGRGGSGLAYWTAPRWGGLVNLPVLETKGGAVPFPEMPVPWRVTGQINRFLPHTRPLEPSEPVSSESPQGCVSGDGHITSKWESGRDFILISAALRFHSKVTEMQPACTHSLLHNQSSFERLETLLWIFYKESSWPAAAKQ